MLLDNKILKKRVLAGILASFLGLSTVYGIAYFSSYSSIQASESAEIINAPKYDVDDFTSENAFKIMTDLEFIQPDSNGTYSMFNTVTRADAAVFLTRLLGIENSKIPLLFAPKKFSDLNSDHWAYKSVMLLASTRVNGIQIVDTTSGTFNPDQAISQEDFLKMFSIILGYGSKEPKNYTEIANNLGLKLGAYTDSITQLDMALTTYSAFDVKIKDSNETILSKYLKMVKFTGVVSENPIGDGGLNANQIKIDIKNTFNGKFDKQSENMTFIDPTLKLGPQYVCRPILGIAKKDGSEIVAFRSLDMPYGYKTVTRDSIHKANGKIDLSSSTITYTFTPDNDKKVDLSENMMVIYNSKKLGTQNLSEIQQILNNQNSEYPCVQGEVHFFCIDPNATKFDSISIENYQTMIVDSQNKYTMQIRGKTIGNSIDLLSYSIPDKTPDAINGSIGDPYLVTYLFDKDGNHMSEEAIQNIKEWDVIRSKHIKGVNGKEYNYCSVFSGDGNTVTGTIKNIKDGILSLRVDLSTPITDPISKVVTRDEVYELSANLQDLNINQLANLGIKVGLEPQEFCLDSFGKIAAIKKADISEESVSYVANVGLTSLTLVDQHGKLKNYGINPIILVDRRETSYPIFSMRVKSGDVLAYQLDKNGKIYKISVPRKDMAGQTSNIDQFIYNLEPVKSATYHASSGALVFNNNQYDTVYTNKSTKFFIVPSNQKLANDPSQYGILDQELMTDGQILNNVRVISVDNDRFAKLVLIYNIDEQVIDADYNSLGMFDGLTDNGKKVNVTKDGFSYTDNVGTNLVVNGMSKLSQLVQGQVIFPEYSTEFNSIGDTLRKITAITNLYNGKFILNQEGLHSYLNNRNRTRMYFGEVLDRQHSMLKLNDIISNRQVGLAIPSNSSVTVYDFTRPEGHRRYESSIQMIDIQRQNRKYEVLVREFDSRVFEIMIYVYAK